MKADTVTTKFRSQLTSLMEVISQTDVQYVRCIKPNSKKSKAIFDRPMIVGQLRCAGMIEAIRISRAAYPYRITHVEFVERFGSLRPNSWLRRQAPSDDAAGQCRALLLDVLLPSMLAATHAGAKDKHFELGKTRVYFSSGVLEHLEHTRGNLVFQHIGSIQRVWRGTRVRRWFLLARRAVITCQAAARCGVARARFRRVVQATFLAQRLARGWAARRRFR